MDTTRVLGMNEDPRQFEKRTCKACGANDQPLKETLYGPACKDATGCVARFGPSVMIPQLEREVRVQGRPTQTMDQTVSQWSLGR